MRERLEPLSLSESIPNLTGAQIDRLDELQAGIEKDDDLQHFLDLDCELHLLSYAGCDSDQLIGAVTRLWNSTQYYRRAFMMFSGPQRRWVVNAEHSLLLNAIRRRDIVEGEHFLTVHIRRTRICFRSRDAHPGIPWHQGSRVAGRTRADVMPGAKGMAQVMLRSPSKESHTDRCETTHEACARGQTLDRTSGVCPDVPVGHIRRNDLSI